MTEIKRISIDLQIKIAHCGYQDQEIMGIQH